MMKLRSLLLFAGALFLSVLLACDNVEPGDANAGFEGRSDRRQRFDLWSDGGGILRARADAAFAQLDSRPTRFESRIGPQPWPDDLPARWPKPENARVLADTRQSEGNRLLLVDLPGSPDQALDSYRDALRRGGYDISRPEMQTKRHALHAKRGSEEVVLKFFRRDRLTRLEILFVGRAS